MIDADKTLAPEDAGKLFWTAKSSSTASAEKTLFKY